jgi:hypothetical protein
LSGGSALICSEEGTVKIVNKTLRIKFKIHYKRAFSAVTDVKNDLAGYSNYSVESILRFKAGCFANPNTPEKLVDLAFQIKEDMLDNPGNYMSIDSGIQVCYVLLDGLNKKPKVEKRKKELMLKHCGLDLIDLDFSTIEDKRVMLSNMETKKKIVGNPFEEDFQLEDGEGIIDWSQTY